MTKKIFFVAKIVCVFGALLLALPALAQFSDVPVGVTPATCPANVPGCNTPLNVGTLTQTKTGGLNIGGTTMIGAVLSAPVAWSNLLSGALPAGTYQYRYTITNISATEIEFSAPSSPITLTTPGTVSFYITSLQPNPNYFGYRFYRKVDGGNWVLVKTTTFSSSYLFSDNGLPATVGNYPTGGNLTIANSLLIPLDAGNGKVLTSNASGLASWKTPSSVNPSSNFWELVTGKTDTVKNVAAIKKVQITGDGAGTPIFQVDGSYYDVTTKLVAYGGKIGINGTGADFYGNQGVYTHSDTPNGIGITGLSQGLGETYGGRFISPKIGSYNKGSIGLYAADMNHAYIESNSGRDNRVPFALANNSTQWAGYFDGNVNINGGLYINGTLINNLGNDLWTGSKTGNINSANTGNVGIGVAAPGSKLQVAGSIRSQAALNRFVVTNGYSNMWNMDNNGGTLRFFREDFNETGNGSNGAVRMVILDNGNVGIGTTYPSTKLDINGTAKVTGLILPTGAAANNVLTSDAYGNASWKPIAQSSGGNNVITQSSITKIYDSSRWIKVEAYCPAGTVRVSCSSYQSDCEESNCGNHGVKPITNGCQGWFDNDSSTEDRVDAYCLN